MNLNSGLLGCMAFVVAAVAGATSEYMAGNEAATIWALCAAAMGCLGCWHETRTRNHGRLVFMCATVGQAIANAEFVEKDGQRYKLLPYPSVEEAEAIEAAIGGRL